VRVEKPGELERTLRDAMASPVPILVDVVVA
jgi:thiamine pyrophosphate-dependent acetolactate synthase large subunit-like protein